jgi:hypothetical protein
LMLRRLRPKQPLHLTAAALPFMMKLRKVTSRFP